MTDATAPLPLDECPLCRKTERDTAIGNALAVVKRDRHPVSPGHCLIVPRRHVASFFDTTLEERSAMVALVDEAKAMIERDHRPDGFNLGINDGAAAGQSILHVHLHVIPRYRGDTRDPRGGIRWVLPEKAVYARK